MKSTYPAAPDGRRGAQLTIYYTCDATAILPCNFRAVEWESHGCHTTAEATVVTYVAERSQCGRIAVEWESNSGRIEVEMHS